MVYANQTAIALTDSAITITWKRREGSSAETALTAGETVSGNVLTISANKLAGVSSGLLTYIAYISYLDPDNGLTTNATADISFALVKTGENAKSAWISGAQVFKYDADGAVSPAQITLTANVQNVVLSKWQYWNASDAWQDYPTTGDNATITGTSLIVKPTHGIWVGDCATLRIVTNDESAGGTAEAFRAAIRRSTTTILNCSGRRSIRRLERSSAARTCSNARISPAIFSFSARIPAQAA